MDLSPTRLIARLLKTVNQREAMLMDIAPWVRRNAARSVTVFGTLMPMAAVTTPDVRHDGECVCVDGWRQSADGKSVMVIAGPNTKRVVSFTIDGHRLTALQGATYLVGDLYVTIAQCFEHRDEQGPLAGIYCLAITPDNRVFIVHRRLERVHFADQTRPWPPEPE